MLVMKVISVNFVPNVNFLLSCIKSDPGEYFSRPPVRIQELVTEHYLSEESDFFIFQNISIHSILL